VVKGSKSAVWSLAEEGILVFIVISKIFMASTQTLIQWLIWNTKFCIYNTCNCTFKLLIAYIVLSEHGAGAQRHLYFYFYLYLYLYFNIMGLKQIHPFLQFAKFFAQYCDWVVTCRNTKSDRMNNTYIFTLHSLFYSLSIWSLYCKG
jgi:hypothetical protein